MATRFVEPVDFFSLDIPLLEALMAHLAYYFSTFPALTTTFAQHQVRATERLGLHFILAANRRPGPTDFIPKTKTCGTGPFT